MRKDSIDFFRRHTLACIGLFISLTSWIICSILHRIYLFNANFNPDIKAFCYVLLEIRIFCSTCGEKFLHTSCIQRWFYTIHSNLLEINTGPTNQLN